MSATPEQIVERLEKHRLYFWSGSSGPEYQRSYLPDEAAALIRAQAERVRVLELALVEIASSKTAAELDEDQYEHADFEGGYGLLIERARAALKAAP